jgi:hypothetical protein
VYSPARPKRLTEPWKQNLLDSEVEEWVSGLAVVVPKLRAAYDGHIGFYGVGLSHVFFGDVARWAESEYERDAESTQLNLLLTYLLSGALGGDGYVENVISVSFVENLYGSKLLGQLPGRLDETARVMYPSEFLNS